MVGNLDYNYALNYGQYYLIILRVRQLRETGQLHPSAIKGVFVMLHASTLPCNNRPIAFFV